MGVGFLYVFTKCFPNIHALTLNLFLTERIFMRLLRENAQLPPPPLTNICLPLSLLFQQKKSPLVPWMAPPAVHGISNFSNFADSGRPCSITTIQTFNLSTPRLLAPLPHKGMSASLPLNITH
jgi:hypothetical protein